MRQHKPWNIPPPKDVPPNEDDPNWFLISHAFDVSFTDRINTLAKETLGLPGEIPLPVPKSFLELPLQMCFKNLGINTSFAFQDRSHLPTFHCGKKKINEPQDLNTSCVAFIVPKLLLWTCLDNNLTSSPDPGPQYSDFHCGVIPHLTALCLLLGKPFTFAGNSCGSGSFTWIFWTCWALIILTFLIAVIVMLLFVYEKKYFRKFLLGREGHEISEFRQRISLQKKQRPKSVKNGSSLIHSDSKTPRTLNLSGPLNSSRSKSGNKSSVDI